MFEISNSGDNLDSSVPDELRQNKVRELIGRIIPTKVDTTIDRVSEEQVKYLAREISTEQLLGNSFLEKRQGNVIIDNEGRILVLALRHAKYLENPDFFVVQVSEWRRGSEVMARDFVSYV